MYILNTDSKNTFQILYWKPLTLKNNIKKQMKNSAATKASKNWQCSWEKYQKLGGGTPNLVQEGVCESWKKQNKTKN